MAKFGPLANSDSCTGVSRVLERLITHLCLVLLVELMYVCLGPIEMWLGATKGAVGVVTEGVGAMGAADVEELPLALDLVLELLGRRCECLLKVTWQCCQKFQNPL